MMNVQLALITRLEAKIAERLAYLRQLNETSEFQRYAGQDAAESSQGKPGSN